jgi:hypothetical protein
VIPSNASLEQVTGSLSGRITGPAIAKCRHNLGLLKLNKGELKKTKELAHLRDNH